MARPQKNTVDYFPFLCKEGKAMFYIEQKYKNNGFATWVKILRQLCVTNYHYLDLSHEADAMFLSAKCGVDLTLLNDIISDLCVLGEFDKELWENNKVIWCPKLIESIQDAYAKRNNKCITKQGVRDILNGLNSDNSTGNSETGTGKPQSKLDKTGLDNNKEKKKDEVDNSKEFSPEVENCYQKILQFFDEKYHPNSTVKIIQWKNEIRRLNEIDGVSFEKIIEIVRWARRDSFWNPNFLSIKKLRRTNGEGVMFHVVFQAKMEQKAIHKVGGTGDNPDEWFKKDKV